MTPPNFNTDTKMYLLSNMGILGIYVWHRGAKAFQHLFFPTHLSHGKPNIPVGG